MQIRKFVAQQSPWFRTFMFISAFLCLVIPLERWLPNSFHLLNLRHESNFAALFSGLFLLVIGLHAFDGWALNRISKPQLAKAWIMLSLVLLALSFDEIGSFHERVPSIGGLSEWWSLLPFGLVFGGMVGYALLILYRDPDSRDTAILITIGFLLFGSIVLQEYIEHKDFWSTNRYLRFLKATVRPLIEEGTELLGMIVLLYAAINNTGGILSRGNRAVFPVFEAVVYWRHWALVLGLISAPLISYVTQLLSLDGYGHGKPADWPAAALFLLAALAAARPAFVDGGRVGGLGWGLVTIGTLGCASTILKPDSPFAIPLLAILSGAAFVIWVLDSRYTPKTYLPVSIILLIAVAGAWLGPQSDFVTYTVIQYVALAIYWVNAAAVHEVFCRASISDS